MNKDYITQESTENLTTQIIENSEEIMGLLKRDKIQLKEVDNYHLYPIADNNTPQLSSDRLEYSLSNALFTYKLSDIEKIREIYNDIKIVKNEHNIDEMAFKTKKIAREFVKITSRLSVIYREDRTRYSMQFLADIMKKLNEENLVTLEDLYKLKDKDIIEIIRNSKYKNVYEIWEKAKKVKVSPSKPKDIYYVHLSAKVRYIDPLVNNERISRICKIAKKQIEKNLSYNMDNYVFLDGINDIDLL